jgi:hypothetical protein
MWTFLRPSLRKLSVFFLDGALKSENGDDKTLRFVSLLAVWGVATEDRPGELTVIDGASGSPETA